MPDRRTASSFEPIAVTMRPKRVNVSTMPPTMKTANIRMTGWGTPNRKPEPKSVMAPPAVAHDDRLRPSKMISDRPRAIVIIASVMTKDGRREIGDEARR